MDWDLIVGYSTLIIWKKRGVETDKGFHAGLSVLAIDFI
jgi:hypothetical protein